MTEMTMAQLKKLIYNRLPPEGSKFAVYHAHFSVGLRLPYEMVAQAVRELESEGLVVLEKLTKETRCNSKGKFTVIYRKSG